MKRTPHQRALIARSTTVAREEACLGFDRGTPSGSEHVGTRPRAVAARFPMEFKPGFGGITGFPRTGANFWRKFVRIA